MVPGAAALLMAIAMPAYEGITDPLERIWRSAVAFAVFGAYPPAFIIGLPAFFMLRRHVNATIINCAATGAVVAALPWLVLALSVSWSGRPAGRWKRRRQSLTLALTLTATLTVTVTVAVTPTLTLTLTLTLKPSPALHLPLPLLLPLPLPLS